MLVPTGMLKENQRLEKKSILQTLDDSKKGCPAQKMAQATAEKSPLPTPLVWDIYLHLGEIMPNLYTTYLCWRW